MKSFKRIAVSTFLTALVSMQVFGQDDVDKLLTESVADAEKLIGAYVSPLMKSASSSLNQGWYNTAKAHKIGGVDLTITVNAMTIPSKELFYNVGDLKLTALDLHPTSPDYAPNKKLAPTIFGPEREPVFYVKDPGSNNFNEPPFKGPSGIDLKENIGKNVLPMPMAHLGIGLPKGTDLKIRFVPSIDLGDEGTLKMFGIGIMHDVKQWIPGIKMLPFDLSGFVGYTKFKMTTEFDEESTRNAEGVFEMSATTIQGLISKKFSVLTLYGGLGYNIAKSKLAMRGEYDIDDDGDYADTREKNPVNLDFTASGPRATAGFRLKLAVITLHADYTLQKYNCLSVGFGINVR
jgi:hypothetical protein